MNTLSILFLCLSALPLVSPTPGEEALGTRVEVGPVEVRDTPFPQETEERKAEAERAISGSIVKERSDISGVGQH